MTEPKSTPAPIPSTDPLDQRRWSRTKQADFLRQLSATHSVSQAARSVGMSRQSAYRLRSRLKGSAFDLAWEVAFHHSYDVLAHAALERALNGVEVPVFFQGEQVGSYRRFDERLTVALLQWSTAGGVPVMGRRGVEAERHAGRFEELLAQVAAGRQGPAQREDDGDPFTSGELERVRASVSPAFSEAEFIAEMRGRKAGRKG